MCLYIRVKNGNSFRLYFEELTNNKVLILSNQEAMSSYIFAIVHEQKLKLHGCSTDRSTYPARVHYPELGYYE